MLRDLLVLDLSRVLAGPYCTQLLADLGARVVKVEPLAGDETRRWGPPYEGGESAYYLSVNRGKESIAVDLKDPRGRALVHRLALRADVLVENAKAGTLGRYGLDYASLAAQNPGLVYLSITGYGQDGPRAHEPGYDAAMQAHSGLMAMTGYPGGPPVKLGVAWIDVLTGVHGATAVLAALVARGRGGQGAHIDLSLFDVALASMVNQGQSTLLTGAAPERLGSAHPNIVPYQTFAAADGDMVVAVGNDAQFAHLCQVLEEPELAQDERFATNAGRLAHREELVGRLASRLRGRTRAAWVAALTAAGVPATAVATLPEALADPQARARGMVIHGPHPTIGTLSMVGSPLAHVRLPGGADAGAAARPEDTAAPPLLGQHTRAVLGHDLGLSAGEVAELEAAGVVRTAEGPAPSAPGPVGVGAPFDEG